MTPDELDTSPVADARRRADVGTAALARAKQPRNLLAGQYGHPVHPVLVTVPIGAWIASVVFDIVALASAEKEAAFAEAAYWLIGIGIVGAVLAAAFGLLDLSQIERGTRAFKTGLTHMTMNLVVVAVFVVDFLLRFGDGYDEATAPGLVLSLVALALLSASGWLGGMLAYRYGVRVADEAHQLDGFR